jgi:hypothetical protein
MLKSINPYYYGVYQIMNRLLWDLRIESWLSRKKLRSLKDKYLEQKAVILCNGPSLLKTDFSLLEGVFTFGLNKINLLFDKHDFRPSCVVAVNKFVIEQNAEYYNHTDIPIFINSISRSLIKLRPNVTFLHHCSQYKFAQDCSISMNTGPTVTFSALELAFHMGFSEVAIIGCDHNFVDKGISNSVVVSSEKDKNHFDPNYFAGGVKWNLPDLSASENFYTLAHETFLLADRKIFNCTEGGKLEIFPRTSLLEFLQ